MVVGAEQRDCALDAQFQLAEIEGEGARVEGRQHHAAERAVRLVDPTADTKVVIPGHPPRLDDRDERHIGGIGHVETDILPVGHIAVERWRGWAIWMVACGPMK